MGTKKVIYLIGPTEAPDSWRAFEEADDLLTSRGYCVLNPATLPQSLPAFIYVAISRVMRESADAVLRLPGTIEDPRAAGEYLDAICANQPSYTDIEKLCEEVPAK